MPDNVFLLLFPLLGYLSGSLAFAVYVTRMIKGVDVRDGGSKHATTTNTIRQVGFGPGALVGILDLAKGFVPVYLAKIAGCPDWLIGLTVAAAIAGHCWPIFAGFRGGMGLAAAGGGMLAVAPLSFVMGLGWLIALVLVIKHGARASVIMAVTLAPFLWVLGQRGTITWVTALGGLVLAARFLVDWQRQYRELWLDREKA